MYAALLRRSRSRSRDKHSRSATPERKTPVNAEGAITIKDEPLDKVIMGTVLLSTSSIGRYAVMCEVVGRFHCWCWLSCHHTMSLNDWLSHVPVIKQ